MLSDNLHFAPGTMFSQASNHGVRLCATAFGRIMGAFFLAFTLTAQAQAVDPSDWDAVTEAGSGQTVYFNAWGGSENINAYIDWAGDAVKRLYDIDLVHVKLDDTANAVAKIVAEKSAGKDSGGSIDLIWINGENFASLKENGLLLSPGWTQGLPNWNYVDLEDQPTILTDFTIPTDGQESPWGAAKLVFFYDSARIDKAKLPDSAEELLDYVKANPGRFSYPQPPDFVGSSFLKQILSETIDDPAKLLQPVDEARFESDSQPLWDYLDAMTPLLWRQGRAYPQNYPAMKQMLADNEVDIIFAFNPSEASAGIAAGELPDTIRSFTFSGGTLGNTHFVAIPYNANAPEGALLVADFLISPEAQARKQDPQFWGDPTVLDVSALPEDDQAAFKAIDLGVATLAPEDLGPTLDEPHPTWMSRIESEWSRRYGNSN